MFRLNLLDWFVFLDAMNRFVNIYRVFDFLACLRANVYCVNRKCIVESTRYGIMFRLMC